MSSFVKCNLSEFLYQKGLTPRQIEVVSLTLKCKTQKEIADLLSVAVKTIKYHNTLIYKKMYVKNKSELIVKLKDYIMDDAVSVSINDKLDKVDVSVELQQDSKLQILPFGVIDEKSRANLEQIRAGT